MMSTKVVLVFENGNNMKLFLYGFRRWVSFSFVVNYFILLYTDGNTKKGDTQPHVLSHVLPL